jgi:hypothetical protein
LHRANHVTEIGLGKDKKMKTGTDAKERGTYLSECCDFEAEFSEDQTFTRCPKCSSLTTWELVDNDWPVAA